MLTSKELVDGNRPRTSGPSCVMDFAFKFGLRHANLIISAVWSELSFFMEFCPGQTVQYSAGIYFGFSLLPTFMTGKAGFLIVKL